MNEAPGSEHLSSSLTDLMTSLMVIFILLLLVFISGTAGKDTALRDQLLGRLREGLKQFGEKSVQPDPRDPSAILIVIPDQLMNFAVGKSDLKPEGAEFLARYVPRLASVVCDSAFRASVESVVVEGHTDEQGFGGSQEESENRNLKLSQDRSMGVVSEALKDLKGRPDLRGCFLAKLSASGRGQQEPGPTLEESRRVVLKIHVKAKEIQRIEVAVK